MPSGPEWFIVLAVVLVIFGGSQLPKLARNLGKAQKEFKDGLSEGQKEAEANADAAEAATVRSETKVEKVERPEL
jgi:sec-independent protein translocase protein TatA